MEARRVPVASVKMQFGVNNCAFSGSHAWRGLSLLSAFCFLFSALSALAQNTYPVAWDWPSNTTANAIMDQFPWLRLQPERVDIALSLDGGATYEPLANGVESTYGTNVWYFDLPDQPQYLSTDARVRVSSQSKYRQPQTVVEAQVSIVGIVYVAPPATVTNGASITLRWTAAGAGSLVQLGTRVIGAQSWVPQAVFASVDANKGTVTNSAVWAVSGLQALPTEIILQSMTDPLCYRRHTLEVQ
jgi:hypothetical protein